MKQQSSEILIAQATNFIFGHAIFIIKVTRIGIGTAEFRELGVNRR
jgi:hypothetical protein